MISSSFSWIARVSRFCEYWSPNATSSVTTDATAEGTSSQRSEKPVAAPQTSQTAVAATAIANAQADPTTAAVPVASLRNHPTPRHLPPPRLSKTRSTCGSRKIPQARDDAVRTGAYPRGGEGVTAAGDLCADGRRGTLRGGLESRARTLGRCSDTPRAHAADQRQAAADHAVQRRGPLHPDQGRQV